MSAGSTLGIAADQVKPVTGAPGSSALADGDVPVLDPPRKSSSGALVPVTPQSAPPWWHASVRRTPPAPNEPELPDVLKAGDQLTKLRLQIDHIHRNLPSDIWLGGHNEVGDVFAMADSLRASIIASLSGLKLRLDAAAAGAEAATSPRSRAEFERITLELRGMDAERPALEKRAREQHAALKTGIDARTKAEEARALAEKQRVDTIIALSPEERERITNRIEQARSQQYGFARHAHGSPGWASNANHQVLPTDTILTVLARMGSVDFNAMFPQSPHLMHDGWERITSLPELERALDKVLGHDPTKRRE